MVNGTRRFRFRQRGHSDGTRQVYYVEDTHLLRDSMTLGAMDYALQVCTALNQGVVATDHLIWHERVVPEKHVRRGGVRALDLGLQPAVR